MTKEIKSIIEDVVDYGECFIGTVEVQGMKAVKRYNKARKEFEKLYPGKTLVWSTETGMCWWM